mgnify:CR=1 FL=1
MKRFNLSEWALRHRSVVIYLMLVIVVTGIGSYLRLGRSEDPDFTVKTMVVQVAWPGATVGDTLEQITDRIESKLQETPSLDYVKSFTPAQVDATEDKDVTFPIGPQNTMTLKGADYLIGFALPNFYFHATTAYDILRQCGVEIGKRDFLGRT